MHKNENKILITCIRTCFAELRIKIYLFAMEIVERDVGLKRIRIYFLIYFYSIE